MQADDHAIEAYRKENPMRRTYLMLSLGIIALGVVHVIATPRYFAQLTSAAVWFASGGLAMMLVGGLNLLCRAYGEMALGIQLACVLANVLMTGFALLAGYAGGASALQFAMVLGLMGGATLCSLLPAAQGLLHVRTRRRSGASGT